MRLLHFKSNNASVKQLEGERVILRRPVAGDYSAWARLRGDSAGFLQPFEPTWAEDELSRSAYRARLRRHDTDINSGRGLPWFLFDRKDSSILLGGITISNIRRGVSDTCTMGYWMGEEFAGKGYMRDAVERVCRSLFSDHDLNRIEAATVLDNPRSQQLLINCGFQQEGTARSYLKINGHWSDHYLYALLKTDISGK